MLVQFSGLFTTELIDRRGHRLRDKYNKDSVNMINTFGKNLAAVKDWIDRNPEYLLIVLSDHGGEWEEDNVLSTHGPSGGGNEAFVVFYSPKIRRLVHQNEWIQTGRILSRLLLSTESKLVRFMSTMKILNRELDSNILNTLSGPLSDCVPVFLWC